MKKNCFLLVTLICCIICSLRSVAQFQPFDNFAKSLTRYTSQYAQEKVYLHLDKPYYAVGDDIWFKAYVLEAPSSTPSQISKILYVELINEKDSVQKQLKLPLSSGVTWGDFKLTDEFKEGNYRIRSYTQWMRNADPAFFYDKTLKIGNSWANEVFTSTTSKSETLNGIENISSLIKFTDKKTTPYINCQVSYQIKNKNTILVQGKAVTDAQGQVSISFTNKQPVKNKPNIIYATITLPNKQQILKEIVLKESIKDIDVQFFAEGGKAVVGLPNKIGFKAINSAGLGEHITGHIQTSDGTEILSFESNSLGMGSFYLNPVSGLTYQAVIKSGNGSTKTFSLPKAEENGIVLSVNNNDDKKIIVKNYFSNTLLNTGNYLLLIHHNGKIYLHTEISSKTTVSTLSVPKDSLPSGIIQIALFSPDLKLLNERIAFINNLTDKIVIEHLNLKPQYKAREKVDLSLKANNDNLPVQGSFSVAVTNTSTVKTDPENESNILTGLLLTSDLSGYVEKPNYYFLKDDKKNKEDLDNLLLTQGWRKINYEQVNQNTPVNIAFQQEKELSISGTITKSKNPVVQGKVSLMTFAKIPMVIDTLTDSNGHFTFDNIQFPDSTKFIIQAKTEKDKKSVEIILDTTNPPEVSKNKNTADNDQNVNQSVMSYLQQSDRYFEEQTKKGLLNRTIQLKEVNITEQKAKPIASTNLNGAGNADAIITAKDLENTVSLTQYLVGRIAGIKVGMQKVYARGDSVPMAIFIDGLSVDTVNTTLDDIAVDDIETIEILKNNAYTAIYGSDGFSGAIIVTTKRGKVSGSYNRYTPGVISYIPKGFTAVREFYSPKYDVKPDNRPDLRSTVFWDPQVITDKEGHTKINYFNPDVPGTYRIVIEGIDIGGNLARKVLTYEVK
ncbi:TonB-dependent receptor plug domain-containing protein [Pedobacter montanisoli]|uniref:TonB-dependent receptor plug domain-containing protein n=1 Tax=Pedobacter montanisoli TaxID=2923277 RepID=A0ABS9ZS81_9SPHI|nr:TonB-dependent receptor plug domain-containing protein [Pedobacter montanisoli]MCJ0741363.1 TonB-dependent receptor plug domain-containing protein [Pedobacter montanisoli]